MMQTRCETVASTDGTPIAVWITGEGPSLLAIHGTAADHTAWDRVIPLLAPTMTVAVIDRRGRGASGDAERYEIEREVDDAVAVAAALPGPVHVYGHSFGGYVAMHAAPRIPNLAALTLYEGGIMPAGMELAPSTFLDDLDALVAAGQREEALEAFMRQNVGLDPAGLDALKAQPSWRGRVDAVHTISRELRALGVHGADPVPTKDVTAPVQLLVGGTTDSMRRAWFESLAGLFQDVRVTVLPGQGHIAHVAAPELLAGALLEFVGQRAAG
ncbi:alpha/beta hydrolase [Sinomonas notoginsengisoli]|uniref:alpha/beta fold hydrolase n=1 Tax=Sinomonas notoginsengisoli TaxID=1457311 RepID=UPI001F2D8A2C|nr:alpha/beta hydrolase [Sinomonas notoginsengisoli]